jgi:cellobiose phosphorylase
MWEVYNIIVPESHFTTGYLLGIRADYSGLIVDPQLPENEPPVTVSCTFRNCRYEIVIRKGNGKRLLVNGIEQLFGTPIQPKANTTLNVECEI